MDSSGGGVDLSGLHREIDRLKSQLCRCNHQGECLACRGFEQLRELSQMVAHAAAQPVLLQVAQEAAVKDMMAQLGTAGERLQQTLAGDPRLQDLLGQVVERVAEDLGGPEELQRLFGQFGGFPGSAAPGSEPIPPDDRPSRPPAPEERGGDGEKEPPA